MKVEINLPEDKYDKEIIDLLIGAYNNQEKIRTIDNFLREIIDEVHKDHYGDTSVAYYEVFGIVVKLENYLRSIGWEV